MLKVLNSIYLGLAKPKEGTVTSSGGHDARVDELIQEIAHLKADYLSKGKATSQTTSGALEVKNQIDVYNDNNNSIQIGFTEDGSPYLATNNSLSFMADTHFTKAPTVSDNMDFSDVGENALLHKGQVSQAVSLGITKHNLDDQSHNDIRNELSLKAERSVVNNLIAQLDDKAGKDRVDEIQAQIDEMAGDVSALEADTVDCKDSACKSKENTFLENNAFLKDIVLPTGARIVDPVSNYTGLTFLTEDSNTQKLYLGSHKLWLKAPDEAVIESEIIKTKRRDASGNWIEYINIDSGNVKNYITVSGGSDTHGIKADYAVHYGILDCPNGLIDTKITSREVTINAGVVLRIPGNDYKFTISSPIKYPVSESGEVVLFLTKTVAPSGTVRTGFIEAGKVFYQEEEPEDGETGYLAWWNPNVGLWQFKSNDTGNVWREAIATPIANLNMVDTGVLSINYIGYRIIDDDIFAQLSSIESLHEQITGILTRLDALEEARV